MKPSDPVRAEVEIVPGTTVAALWEELAAGIVFPTEAAKRDCRATFFAGFAAALQVVSRGGEDDVTAELAVAWLTALRREVRAVVEQMAKGG